MGKTQNELNLILIADRQGRSKMLAEQLHQAGTVGLVRRLPYGGEALDCAKRRGNYRWRTAPDLVIFDYSHVDEYSTDILRQLAFGKNKAKVPIIILTSPESQAELDEGRVDGGDAVMFAPTALPSFAEKLKADNRGRFIKALKTLYEYGPILVRMPGWVLEQDSRELVMSA